MTVPVTLTSRTKSYGLGVYTDAEIWRADYPSYTPTYVRTHADLLAVMDDGWMKGQDIASFHKLVKQGVLLPHTDFVHVVRKGYGYGHTETSGAKWRTWSVGNIPYFDYWGISEDDLYAHAPGDYKKHAAAAAAKIYTSGHDTLTFLAELSQLKGLFVETGVKLATMRIPSNWRALSSDWLSGRYGWRVLYYDILSLNKAIKNLNNTRKRFSEKVGNTTTTRVTTVPAAPIHSTSCSIAHEVQDIIKVGVHGSVTADIEIADFQFNPLRTAWELIPLSFVIDWFLSIGQSLAAASFMLTASEYTASAGYRVSMTRNYHTNVTVNPGYGANVSYSGYCNASLEVRTPTSVSLTPHFQVKLDVMKVIDLLALVIQRWR